MVSSQLADLTSGKQRIAHDTGATVPPRACVTRAGASPAIPDVPLSGKLEHRPNSGHGSRACPFTSDRGITPAAAARLAEQRMASPLSCAGTHPHPGQTGRAPDDRRRVAARRPLPANPRPVGKSGHRGRRHPRTCGCPPPSRCPSNTIRSAWRNERQLPTTSPAAEGEPAGTGFGWNTDGTRRPLTCRLAGGGQCCARYIERPCGRCGPRRRRPDDGEFVRFGPAGPWPKPARSHVGSWFFGAAGTEKNFKWIAWSADGWITPRDVDIDAPVRLLQDTWAAGGRAESRASWRWTSSRSPRS